MKPSMFFASFFGAGFFPRAPGTFASLAALAVFRVLPSRYAPHLTAAAFVAALVIIAKTGRYLSSDDDPRIVLDEVCGMWLLLCLVPAGFAWQAAALALFRFFDIIKPLGIKRIQKLPYEWGIMADDALAAVYCAATIKAAAVFLR